MRGGRVSCRWLEAYKFVFSIFVVVFNGVRILRLEDIKKGVV